MKSLLPKKVCRNCNKEYPRHGGRYSCSLACRDAYIIRNSHEIIECKACSKPFEKKKNKKTKLCSMKCVGKNNKNLLLGTRDENLWVEIKGCVYYDRFDKTSKFVEEHSELKFIVANYDTLRERFGLDLSQKRLHETCVEA
jgi:hypothetical protein